MIGQDLNYTHYTVESGLLLPSNEVYGIVFDQNNVLWATTDRGVWRYDGYTPTQFTVSEGLKENTNFRIFCDASNRIWVSSINNYVSQIIGDSVRVHPMSQFIHKAGSAGRFIQQIALGRDSTIYLSYNRPGLLSCKPGEKPGQVNIHKINHPDASIAIHYQPDCYYWDMINIPDTCQGLEPKIEVDNGWTYITCGILDIKKNFHKELCPIGENEFLFSFSKRLFHIKNGLIIAERIFSKDITALYISKRGCFWVGFEGGGVKRFMKGDLKTMPQEFLRDETITGIAEDLEGNYWFTSANNGIFEAVTLDIALFEHVTTNLKDNVITAMTSDGENIYLGTQTGILMKGTELPNRLYYFKPIKLPVVDGTIRKLYYTPDNHLILLNGCLQEIDTAGRPRGIRSINYYPFDYLRKRNGEWLASFTQVIRVVKGDRIIKEWDKNALKVAFPADSTLAKALTRIRTMLLDSHDRKWMGSESSGLFSGNDSVLYPWVKKDSLFGKRTHDIAEAGDNIWVSIADFGLAVIRQDSSFIRITEKDGLSSDIIDVLYAENDEVVWAGTNNGLNRITLKKGSQKPDKIDYYTMREGLPSNRIYQIIKYKEDIWVSTTHGVIRMKPGFTNPPENLPNLIVGPLLINGKSVGITDTMRLKPADNNLVFKYKAISYRKPAMVRYRYKLDGIDKDYIITNNLEARYPDLTYGRYTFNINASYGADFDPTTEKRIVIQIQKHWYETRMAWAITGIILVGLAFQVFLIILRQIRKREAEKRQLLQAEKRSLLSQMNPHFIFNSLNSIQHFVLQNEVLQANNYLTNFSGLIRRILENSKKNLIPLHEEITTLSLYLGMEKLRFENEFEYLINKDPRIDYNETQIPPMLVQPFVENAIWHGLMPLKGQGTLTLSFTYEEDYFYCLIEDNGIGREKAATMKTKREPHISTGIANIQERIELLNKINKKKISLKISDLRNADGSAAGTSVELLIPVDLNS